MIDFWDDPIFSQTLQEWQGIVDLVVRMAGVRAGLVMHVRGDDIEVFVSSQSQGNPYKVGDKEKLLNSGLYCERVIATQEKLLVPNALKSDEWKNNPDIHLNMIAYLGFPVRLPGGRPFGTICLLDDRENAYGPDVIELMQRMRDLIESHLNSFVDSIERKRAAEQLRESEERYRTLLAMSPDGISVVDNTGRLLACNEQCAHLYGYDHGAEMVGRHAAEFYTPESFSHLFGQAAAVLQQGKDVVHDLEATARRRDGSIMDVELSIARVPWSDAPTANAFVTSFRDVTQRNAVQAELTRYRNHLEELVRERTRDLEAEIAERAAAQDALARSEMRLKTAERVARMGSWERNLIADELIISDGLSRVLGLDPELGPQAAYTAAWDAVHPEDLAAAKAAFAHTTATGEPLDVSFRIGLPAGEMRVLRVLGEVACDAAGQPARLRATAQDITERELARENLARRVQELTTLQELGQLGSLQHPLQEAVRIYLERIIALTDLDMAQVFLVHGDQLHLAGVATHLTEQVGQVRTLAVGECLCGLAVQDGQPVYAGEVDGDVRCTRAHCHANGLHSLAALPLRSGNTIIGALSLGAIKPDAFAGQFGFLETIAGLLAVRLQNFLLHQELQERAVGLEETVAERMRELQMERDRTQAILETVGESVVVTDLDGQLLFVNPATTALTGYPRDEELGQRLWHGWTEQARTEVWPEAQAALRAGQTWHGEISGQRRDGALYIAALTGTPLHDELAAAGPVGVVWAQRDITTQKEAARLKDQFVSNVSHELRTPVSIIALCCDNLEAYQDQLDESQRAQTLQDIHAQAHVLSGLVEDILLVSRLDTGRLPRQESQVDLARVVREEVQRQQVLAEKRSQRLLVNAAAPVAILGSEGQLRQVVRNLLDNAMKYTPDGGQIDCSCEIRLRKRAGSSEGGQPLAEAWAVVEVTDNGIGIAAKDMPLVFERFYRAHGESDVSGVGLGLSIAKELVQLHGGWIKAASVPGKGSTFTMYLPVVGQEAMAAAGS